MSERKTTRRFKFASFHHLLLNSVTHSLLDENLIDK